MSAALASVILPPDRRQSATALQVQRGVRRLFAELGHVTIPEFSLANGRRADVIALCGAGKLTIVEIKSSVADFRADRKWPDYRDFCDRFFFAIPEEVPESLIPEECGLIVADAYGAELSRMAPAAKLAAARRARVMAAPQAEASVWLLAYHGRISSMTKPSTCRRARPEAT